MADSNWTSLKEQISNTLGRISRPKKAVVTAGMPYANGPVHVGHLAGAHVPADIYARFLGLLIGRENVMYVCGTDDHGSTSEVAARQKGLSLREHIDGIHESQSATMRKFHIGLDLYTGTSRPETFEIHREYCQEFLRNLYDNGMLEKRTSQQWYDPEMQMFLPDRYVYGTCPKCSYEKAYSEECDNCGATYQSQELLKPQSTVSSSVPVLKDTDHWFLNLWNVVDPMREWLQSKEKKWRKSILQEVMSSVMPSVSFSKEHEDRYKELKSDLPAHKSRYAPGKMIVAQFGNLTEMTEGQKLLQENQIPCEVQDKWAFRSFTRDVNWGIPVPEDKDAAMKGKTLYVWPESLIAPISFTKVALKNRGEDPERYREFWADPDARVYQFLGQDNVFFYVLMQGGMWLGTQKDIHRQPESGELQLTEIFSSYLLQVDGAKMSKSKGNFYTGDQLIDEMGYHPDQVRYFLATLSLSEKNSNLDFETLQEKNKFLAGPLNAAFEKPISACHSKFDGIVPGGDLIGKTAKETGKIVQNYVRMMEKGEYAKILNMVENYARIINSLFTQFKPHDDRHDLKQRQDALYSSFFILRNLVIMLSPFVPETMDKLRRSLNLPESVLSVGQFMEPFPQGHQIGDKLEYFPAVGESSD